MTSTALTRPSGGVLALADDQTWWTERQLAALEQIGVGDAPAGDQLVFLHVSQRTGLDPFARQIHMVSRNAKDGDRWVKKWTIQTGIDGFRLIADRADRRDGTRREYEETRWCDAEGTWSDVWTKATAPTAAKVVVVRDGKRFPKTVLYREYVQTKRDGEPNSMWFRMPANQLAKCAEAGALRMAYPQDLSGLYTNDEMGQADQPAGRAAAGKSGNARMAEVLNPETDQTAVGAAEEEGAQGGAPSSTPPEDIVDADVVEDPTEQPSAQQPPESPKLDMRSQLAKKLFAVMGEAGITDERQHEFLSHSLQRTITSRKQLTDADAKVVIDALEEALAEPSGEDPS